MMDINKMIELAKQFNKAWDECCGDADNGRYPTELYNAICDVDKAMANLVEKMGQCAKACVMASICG